MSLTDDTNQQTIDIPLPEETNESNSNQFNNKDSYESNTESINSWTQQMTNTSMDTSLNTINSNNNNNEENASVDPSVQQSFQSYYSYYSSAYNMPQVMPQSYPYYMPVVQPLVPVLPSIHQSIQTQSQSIAAQNHSKGDVNNDDDYGDNDEDDSEEDPTVAKKPSTKASNVLPIHCNEKMGLNPLIYTNIQQSPYFKNNLFQLKTYHEVIDEIFYNVKHLEPWEKGSRKIGGQTGMCGSVRGVGAGGIISTPFCILYKLFTLKLTRKQVNGLIRHKDSPYIRALGFMYIRFTQPPQHLFQWFEGFLEDEEEVDPKAGGGQPMTIGQLSRHMLTKLDWFSTLFPRVPVPIQKDIEAKLKQRDAEYEEQMRAERGIEDGEVEDEEEDDNRDRRSGARNRHERRRSDSRERRRSRDRKRSRSRSPEKSRSRDDKSFRSNDKHRYKRSRSPNSPHSHRHSRGDYREREREHHRHRHRN